MPTITKDDLLIPQSEQDAIKNALKNTTINDPWTPAITRAIQLVDTYTARYALSDDHYKRLVTPLTLWFCYEHSGAIPSPKQNAYDQALLELRDIRDGKFADLLALKDPQPAQTSSRAGAWGSQEPIRIRAEEP